MDKPDTTDTAKRTGAATDACRCGEPGCEGGLRNNYFHGKLLTPDTFRVEQRYLLERRRLINRGIHGWGVVYGYAVDWTARGLCIQEGLALDTCGRELLQMGAKRLDLDQLIVFDDQGKQTTFRAAFVADPRACWLLRAHYAEQRTDPVRTTDNCRCPRDEWDHTCETVRYTLVKANDADCCAPDDCELDCRCGAGPCCEPDPKLAGEKPGRRGGCVCVCEHLTQLQPGAGCDCPLEPVQDPCGHGHVVADLRHGVSLACIQVGVNNECADWTITGVDPCGPRRLVKRNDLLFDLIRGCDLTRISEIGWKEFHRKQISYELFSEAFGPVDHGRPTYPAADFWVRFSRPVRKSSLGPECFSMTVFSTDREGGWWEGARVPIVGLELEDLDKDGELVGGVIIVVDGSWVEDGLRGTRNLFKGEETMVEIEVRGDFILDCNGQPIDANAIGRARDRTGNGTPGGTFLSSFRVSAALEKRGAPSFPGRKNEGAQS